MSKYTVGSRRDGETMKTLIKKFARRMTKLLPLFAYRWMIKRSVIVLIYHVVSDKALNHLRHLYPYKSPKMFEADLLYLKKHYNIISYKQLLVHLSSQTEIPPNSILLTFDDGYSECFSTVRPLLLKHKIPCTFFITTDFVDNKNIFYRSKISLCIEKCKDKSLISLDKDKIDEVCTKLGVNIPQYLASRKPYLTSDEIKCLASDGFTIGAHTKTHPNLNLLDNRDIEEEIVDSCKIIMSLTGEKAVPFAFPFFSSIDRQFLRNLISKYGFIELFFDSHRLRKEEDFIMNRVTVDSPSLSSGNKSNIPKLLKDAYRKELINNIDALLI
jgi:peptidoglycan/xylan/chitin deacetylase (PgdA/CDA1 family)